ncbi:NnrU family protein [Rhizobium sp. TRM95111]|uniref:NnrU family protein n=1 Tax=Rhizobium alarense TaxID=2846851 RepID=UPI001F241AFE|nr:NnrU family protein [Rhizobium alarense]MCF3641728.1 NnrU family protein [Rhizobium alarense]
MTGLATALLVFIALHSVPALPDVRARTVAMLGRRAYLSLYSLLSVLALVWIFHEAVNADHVELWAPGQWHAHVTFVMVPTGVFLVIAGLFSTNPLSITLRHSGPPGAITHVTRHPVLVGFLLWATGHVFAKGDVRSLLLFGGLGLFSLAGIFVLDRRVRKQLGTEWNTLAAATSVIPFAAVLSARSKLTVDQALLFGLLASTAVTVWLLAGEHRHLFSADPLLRL